MRYGRETGQKLETMSGVVQRVEQVEKSNV